MQEPLASRLQLIFTDAFAFFMGNFRQIAALCLPFLFAISLFQVVLNKIYPATPMAFFAPLVLSLVVYPIYMAALIQLMARRARQEQPKNGELITASIPRWGALLMLKIVVSFLIVAGFGMMIVPGVWLWGRLAFAEFYLVLFGLSPREALRKSLLATKGHLGLILALLLLTNMPILMGGLIADQMIQTLMPNLLFQLLFTTVWALLELFVHVALFRAFMDVVAGEVKPD